MTDKTHEPARAGRFALRNWRVPTRLTALILAPTLVGVLLAGLRVVGSIDSLNGYERTISVAEYSVHLRALAEELALERDLIVWGGSRRKFNVDGKTELTRAQQREVVDPLLRQVTADIKNIDSGFGVRAVEQAEHVANRVASLAGIRANGAPEDYTAIIANLLRLNDELGSHDDDAQIVGDVRALGALAHAKEEVALQRAMLTRELLERSEVFLAYELRDFLASQSRQQGFLATFYTEAPPVESSRLVTLLGLKDVVGTELTKSWALTLGLANESLSRNPNKDATVEQWFQDSTKTIEHMAVVEQRVSTMVQERGQELQSAEQRNALIAGGLILALLLLVLATTVLIARSMVRPLRRLRAEALDIAGMRLPEVVRQMRESGDPDHAPDVQPIGLGSHDEIGEVAKAFDEVHLQAIRLAAEESRLRNNVNAMFVNLSRRTQTLVERQISLIDGLERGEQDGGRLADLFKLDHLATRMRRNSENLLVLAGHEPARKRSQPARLVDVVRASLSEVEDYERVTLRLHRGASVAGHAANDVVHLVAELVENAIAFSPRNTKVLVSSTPIEGGSVLLAVSDTGMSMTPEELIEANRRLAEPPTVDVSVSRRMGLFVVGRLALRHGIRVQLRKGDAGGLIAMVLFPAGLITNPDLQPPTGAPGGQQSLPATGPSQGNLPSAPGSNGLPTRRPSGSRPASGTFSAFGAPSETSGGFPAPQETSGGFSAFGSPSGYATGSPASREHSGAFALPPSGPGAGWVPGLPEPDATAAETTATFPAFKEPSAAQPVFTEHSGAFPIRNTGPVEVGPTPGGQDTPLEQGDEFLPIFASVESAWFRRPTPSEMNGAPGASEASSASSASPEVASTTGPVAITDAVKSTAAPASPAPYTSAAPVEEPRGRHAENIWESRADSGFQAAAAAKDPSLGGVTAAGLPKRTPRANLVPGSVGAAGAAAPAPAPAPRTPVSADHVRNRLASFQQGVRRGRADLAENSVEGLGNEEESS